uniref:uncharacterized protein LOC122609447 n=1 Tax=Erigeron canadensis TaxID=72917 RepID=UPI001CB902C6|nr:uncharacterized protein LOC122609447 [Erigeron canadensis]
METLMKMFFLCFSLCLLFPLTKGDGQLSVYDVLQSYNLPIGLLPNTTLEYNVDPNTGQFSVNLTQPCDTFAAGFQISYEPTITGVISQNKIEELEGVKLKVYFFSIGIKNITRDQDNVIGLKVGWITRYGPISDFSTCNECNKFLAKREADRKEN